jgi:hypothetical protein
VKRLLAGCAAALLLAGCTGSRPPTQPAATPPASATSSASPAAPASADWPTYAHDAARTGVATGVPAVHDAQVKARVKLDGAVYAAPLIVGGTVFAATENDTVYALTAGGEVIWQQHLGSPAPRSQLPCGNVDPLGITGTPVFRDGIVYVTAEYGGPPRHELVALSAADGSIRWRAGLPLPGADPKAMQQRGALTVAGGRVWVPFGGLFGDCGTYLGRVVGVPLSGSGDPISWVVPTTREGGIWTPPGPAVDDTGAMFVSVGNGESTGGQYDGSDSVVTIDPATAKRLDFFAPASWALDNARDADLGSQGPALVGPWVFIAGKSGVGYVLRRSALGGLAGQVSSAEVCRSFGGTAVDGDTVYVPCADGLRAVAIDGAGRLSVRWHADAGIAGSPIVAGGLVWSLAAADGVLQGLDQATGWAVVTVPVGAVTRFASLAISGTVLAVPTNTGVSLVWVS